MKQPVGYGMMLPPGMEHKVLKLKRLLCGLKQASKCWYQNLNGFFIQQGYTRNGFDDIAVFAARCHLQGGGH